MKYKIDDEVVCIKEEGVPQHVGHIWKVVGFKHNFIHCESKYLYSFSGKGSIFFPFTEDEIVLASSLIKELI